MMTAVVFSVLTRLHEMYQAADKLIAPFRLLIMEYDKANDTPSLEISLVSKPNKLPMRL